MEIDREIKIEKRKMKREREIKRRDSRFMYAKPDDNSILS